MFIVKRKRAKVMEKVLGGFGMAVVCFCFTAAFFLGNGWLWGCAIGGALSGVSLLFMD